MTFLNSLRVIFSNFVQSAFKGLLNIVVYFTRTIHVYIIVEIFLAANVGVNTQTSYQSVNGGGHGGGFGGGGLSGSRKYSDYI